VVLASLGPLEAPVFRPARQNRVCVCSEQARHRHGVGAWPFALRWMPESGRSRAERARCVSTRRATGALSSQGIRFLARWIADPIRSFAFRFSLSACPNLTVRA